VKRSASLLVLLLILSVAIVSFPQIEVVKAEGTIYIRADGSVEGTDKIQKNGNLYSFTGDVFSSIVVEKDDIILDGMGFALQGDGIGEGIRLDGRTNVTIKNVKVRDFEPCIYLDNSSNNEISGNTLKSTLGAGPHWITQIRNFSNNNSISGNIIEYESSWDDYAILISRSLYNIIIGNNITSNMHCIGLDNYANHTIISGNTITSTGDWGGVHFFGYNTTFTNNRLIGATLHLYRSSQNTIEDNLVDGKPLIYLDDVSDQVIEGNEAGQIILANCRNIKAKNVDLSNIVTGGIQLLWTNSSEVSNYTGSLYLENSFYNCIVNSNCVEIDFYNSSNNTVTQNTITNSEGFDYSSGITLRSSDYNSITENNITQNRYSGIELWKCNYNNIFNNSLTYNAEGINLQQSMNNTIYGNNISYNHNAGVFVRNSGANRIFGNNFVDNNRHVMGWDSSNILDDGSLGNYWSNYNGTDLNHDGIGDSPYSVFINSHFSVDGITDYDDYPLIAPIFSFDVGIWEWTQYFVNCVSNSTVSDFTFNPQDALIRFDVEGEDGTTGFCRAAIPKDLLTAEDSWTVLVDGTSVTPTVNEDEDSTYLYFIYDHSAKTVEIYGTTAILEFPSWIILPLVLTVTTVVAIYKKRLPKTSKN
jgi:parallel beta-helix repeat protein